MSAKSEIPTIKRYRILAFAACHEIDQAIEILEKRLDEVKRIAEADFCRWKIEEIKRHCEALEEIDVLSSKIYALKYNKRIGYK